jgi:hypothetical protein
VRSIILESPVWYALSGEGGPDVLMKSSNAKFDPGYTSEILRVTGDGCLG